MSIRITTEAHLDAGSTIRNAHSGVRTVHGRSAGAAFVEVCRHALSIAAEHPAVIWADPTAPEGRPWSQRGVQPDAGHGHRPATEWQCTRTAWAMRLVGSRFRVELQTLGPGARVVWTLEIVDTPAEISTPGPVRAQIDRTGAAVVLLAARDELRAALGESWTVEARHSALYVRPARPGAAAASLVEVIVEPDAALPPTCAPWGVQIDQGEFGMQYLGYCTWPTATQAFEAALHAAERFGDELHEEGDHRLCD